MENAAQARVFVCKMHMANMHVFETHGRESVRMCLCLSSMQESIEQ
jgi:hypothetical protein